MKDQSNIRTLLQMLVFTFFSLSGVLIALYGIYQFTVTFVKPLTEFTSTILQ